MTPEEIAAAAAAAEAAAAAKAEADALAAEAAAKAAAEAGTKTAEELAAEAAAASKSAVDDEKAKLLKEVMKYKQEAKDAKAAAEKFKGIDVDKATAALAAQAAAELKELEAKGEYQRIIAQITEQADLKVKEAEERVAAFQTQLDELHRGLQEKELSNNFANSAFVREKLTISGSKVRTLYGSHFDEVDGEHVAYDKPRGEKNRTPLVDANGANLAFEAALEKIVKADPEWERIAKAEIKKGSAASPSGLQSKKGNDQPESGRDKIKAGLGSLARQSLNLKR